MSAGAVVAGLIISLVVFILIIVIIVVCVVVLATPYVLIEQYSAEVRTDYGMGHVMISNEVVVDNYKWWSESAYEGEMFSRVFCNDDNYEEYICQRIGSGDSGHDNCYKLTGDAPGYYAISRAMDKEKSDVPCPTIHDPVLPGHKKRTLTTCDMYEYDYDGSDGTYYQANWVEHDTDYPVMTYGISHDADGNLEYNMTIEYTYFDGDAPTNETGLKPPSGAVVFDFTEGTTGSSISRMFNRVADKVKSFFAPKEQLNTAAATTMKRFQREKLFRERLGIHAVPTFVGTVKSNPAPKNIRDEDIPDSFDAREAWSYCEDIIGNISNQGSCGSCWAMSTAAVLSDRACINNVTHIELSPQYMMSCYPHQSSCNGGYISTVWKDVEQYGTVSWECDPFVAKDTECPATCKDDTPISNTTRVYNVGYNTPWAKDSDARVKAIQKEIMTNGPVTVSMVVFSGFYKYTSGVYHRKATEKYSGGHMVRMIGWGKEGSEEYWLVANSWDTDWGLDGLFKIRRGTNECNIENAVIGGMGIKKN